MKISSDDLVASIAILALTAIAILFVGKPDLHDALLHRVSGGKIPIPAVDPPKP